MKLFLAITSALVLGAVIGYLPNRMPGAAVGFFVQRLDPIQIEEMKVEGDPFSTKKGRAFVRRANLFRLPDELSHIDQFLGGFSTDPPLSAKENFYAVSDGRMVVGVFGVVVGEEATLSVAEYKLVSGYYILSDQRYFKNTQLCAWLKQF